MAAARARRGRVRVSASRATVTRATVLLAPAVVPTVAVLAGGLTTAVLASLGGLPLVGEPRLSTDAFVAVGPDLVSATGVSLAIAAASTVIAASVGLVTALLIGGSRRGGASRNRSGLRMAAGLTLPVPHIVGAASMGLLLADSGLLARWLGIPAGAWPALVGGEWWVAVIAEYAWKESAFVALVVAGVLATRVVAFDDHATMLGAGPWARLRFVTVPLAMPALVASAGVSFVYTLGSYEVAWLLGRPYPEPLPVLANRLFTSADLTARPQAFAVAVTTTAVAVICTALMLALVRRVAVR